MWPGPYGQGGGCRTDRRELTRPDSGTGGRHRTDDVHRRRTAGDRRACGGRPHQPLAQARA